MSVVSPSALLVVIVQRASALDHSARTTLCPKRIFGPMPCSATVSRR